VQETRDIGTVQGSLCGICGGQSCIRALSYPLPLFIQSTSILIYQCWRGVEVCINAQPVNIYHTFRLPY